MAKGRPRKKQICSDCANKTICHLSTKFTCSTCSTYTMEGLTVQPIIPEGDSFYSEYCREFQGAGAED